MSVTLRHTLGEGMSSQSHRPPGEKDPAMALESFVALGTLDPGVSFGGHVIVHRFMTRK